MPVEILWSPLARRRLREIREYAASDKPEAAERLVIRIVAVVESLRTHPRLGRLGAEPGIRELVIGAGPYIVIYGVEGQQVVMGTIWGRG